MSLKNKKAKFINFMMLMTLLFSNVLPSANIVWAEGNVGNSTFENRSNSENHMLGMERGSTSVIPANAVIRFNIGLLNINENQVKPIDGDSAEFWTNEAINAVVDLDVSGDNVKIDKPHVRIKVKKEAVITKPDFAASQVARESNVSEDNDYYICDYLFDQLTGGQHFTFPFPFSFDPNTNVKTGDKTVVEAEFLVPDGATETAAYRVSKEFKAKVANIATDLEWDLGNEYKNDLNEAHPMPIRYVKVPVKDMSETVLPQGTSQPLMLKTWEYIDLPNGATGRVGYIIPKNVTFKYIFDGDYLDSTSIARKIDDKTAIDKTVMKWTDTHTTVLPDGSRVEQPGWYRGGLFNLKNLPLGRPIPIKIEYYINYEEEGEKLLDTKTVYIQLEPKEFTGRGDFAFHRVGNREWFHGDLARMNPEEAGKPVESATGKLYAFLNDKLYFVKEDMMDQGMVYSSEIWNWNDGSEPGKKSGGMVTEIKEVKAELKSKGEYFKSFILSSFNGNSEEDQGKARALETSFDNGGNHKLYGVKADGTEVLLRENIKMNTKYTIEDKAREYQAFKIVFERPVILDNSKMCLLDYTGLTDSEIQRFKDGIYKDEPVKYSSDLYVKARTGMLPIQDTVKYEERHYNNPEWNYHLVGALHPVFSESISDNMQVNYKAGGTPFEFRTGLLNPAPSNWGPIDKITNVKTIALLPSGIEFVEHLLGTKNYEVVKNYKNTGKTAIITTFDDVEISTTGKYGVQAAVYQLKATKDAKRGDNIIETYLIYDNNDVIRPAKLQNKETQVKDTLDMDDDGNKDEIFMRVATTITYVPALEVVLHKEVKNLHDNLETTTSDLDLGNKAHYVVTVFNNSTEAVKRISIIDKLPKANDKSITPDETGHYKERGSTFSTPLYDFVENLEANKEMLKRFDVFYQLEDTDTIEATKEGAWLTKNQVDDISKVKSIKFVLKTGKTINVKETIHFEIPAKLPYDENLDETKDKAVNSAAFSLDNNFYNEANSVTATFVRYNVNGKVYLEDKTAKDGKYNPKALASGKMSDKPLKGIKVALYKSDTKEPAKTPNGDLIESTTDENGEYHLKNYTRGHYFIRVFKPKSYKKVETNNPANDNWGNTMDSVEAEYADSPSFDLDPTNLTSIENAAFYTENYTLTYVVKGDRPNDDSNDAKTPEKVEDIVENTNQTLAKKLTTSVDTKEGVEGKGVWLFDGWYHDEHFTEGNKIESLVITQDETVYGRWIFKPYTPDEKPERDTIEVTKKLNGDVPLKETFFLLQKEVNGKWQNVSDVPYRLLVGQTKAIKVEKDTNATYRVLETNKFGNQVAEEGSTFKIDSINYKVSYSGDQTNGFVITNTQIYEPSTPKPVKELEKIVVNKVWGDGSTKQAKAYFIVEEKVGDTWQATREVPYSILGDKATEVLVEKGKTYRVRETNMTGFDKEENGHITREKILYLVTYQQEKMVGTKKDGTPIDVTKVTITNNELKPSGGNEYPGGSSNNDPKKNNDTNPPEKEETTTKTTLNKQLPQTGTVKSESGKMACECLLLVGIVGVIFFRRKKNV